MRYDYTVMDIYGKEISGISFHQARQEGKIMLSERPDCDPIIDQYDLTKGELSGVYWNFKDGKFVKQSDSGLPSFFRNLK